jgi:Tn3 transposase DDE domain
LAQAVAELGRIDKTNHSFTYVDDESKRRRTLIQLKDRHKLGRAVFHGKRGELRHRHREGQEDQLGALGLVVNIIVLWNTLYIDAALQQLRTEGFPGKGEDLARLSPFGLRPHQPPGQVFLLAARFGATRSAAAAQKPIRSDKRRPRPEALTAFSVPPTDF